MSKEDEMILVVPRSSLPESKTGVTKEGIHGFENLVRMTGFFKRRGDVEKNPHFKQVIPYMVFQYKGRNNPKYFLMQRTKEADPRLRELYTVGIGGHLRKDDLLNQTIIDWGKREFEEEVEYKGRYSSCPLGLINDDKFPVNRVHVGYVVLLKGSSSKIKVNREHQSGSLFTMEELEKYYLKMEPWSQYVYNYLKGGCG